MPRFAYISLVCAIFVGCSAARYRQQADLQVQSLIAEKVACQVWHVDVGQAWPDPRSRFADPHDIDQLPRPSDDPMAAELALDPQPQACCVPACEGTDYLQLMPPIDASRSDTERYLFDAFNAPGEAPRLLTLQNALEVALLNNRTFQDRKEALYLAALDLSLERTAFAPQLFATSKLLYERIGSLLEGGDADTGRPSHLSVEPGDFVGNSIAPGQTIGSEVLSGQTTASYFGRGPLTGTGFGFTRLFLTGGALLLQFANETVFEFAGPFAGTHSQSNATLQLVQPLLQGGGKAVTLEPLTQTERNLLYEVRSYVRFQKELFASIATGSDLTQGTRLEATVANALNEDDLGSVGVLDLLEQAQIVRNEEQNLVFLLRVVRGFEVIERDTEDDLYLDQVMQEVYRSRTRIEEARRDYFSLLDIFKVRIGVPTNLPVVLDANLMEIFDLRVHDCSLPELTKSLAELGLTPQEVEGIAISHRLDLMNAKATVVDRWRKVRVAANGLMGILDVGYEADFFTPDPDDGNHPFDFDGGRSRHRIRLNGELPLVRTAERNAYRATLIEYQRSRRQLMLAEDSVRLEVRNSLRAYEAARRIFQFQRDAVQLACRRVEQTRRLLATAKALDESDEESSDEESSEEEPSTEDDSEAGDLDQQVDADLVDALDLIFAQEDLLESQNELVGAWVSYLAARIELMRDMGILDPMGTSITSIVSGPVPGLPSVDAGNSDGSLRPTSDLEVKLEVREGPTVDAIAPDELTPAVE